MDNKEWRKAGRRKDFSFPFPLPSYLSCLQKIRLPKDLDLRKSKAGANRETEDDRDLGLAGREHRGRGARHRREIAWNRRFRTSQKLAEVLAELFVLSLQGVTFRGASRQRLF